MLSLIAWLAAFLAMLGLLRLASGARAERYRQALLPPLALAYGLAAYLLYTDYLQPFLAWLERLIEQFRPILDLLGWHPDLGAHPLLAFNWAILAGFVLVKPAGRALMALLAALLRLWRRYRPPPPGAEPPLLPELALSPAYEADPKAGIVLDPRWAYSRQVCLGLAAVAFLQLLAGVWIFLLGPPVAAPALPALPLLFFLEAAWYLGGPRRDRLLAEGGLAPDEPAAPAVDYAALWRTCRELWPERVLYAGELRPAAGGRGLEASLAAVEQDLDAGRDVLVKADELTPVLPILARRSRRLLSEGGTVLVLVARDDQAAELAALLTRNPVDPAGEPAARRVADLAGFLKDRDGTDILVATPAALLHGEAPADAWFAKLRLAIVPDLEAAFTGIAALYTLLCQLRARAGAGLQHVLLSHERHALQPSVARNLRLDTAEHVLPSPVPERVWALAWRTEGEPWPQQRLLVGHLGKHLGNEIVLAVPAWQAGAAPIRLYGVAGVPWLEQREELQNDLAAFRPEWRVDPDRSGLARDRLGIHLNPRVSPPAPEGCVVVRDAVCNLSAALVHGMGKGTREILLHLVSPPYLLRDYLADNLDYFRAAPLRALSPRKTVGLSTLADSLWQQLSVAELDEPAVLAELREYAPDVRYAETGLQRLFLDAYGVDVLRDGLLRLRVEPRFTDGEGEGSFAGTLRCSLGEGPAGRVAGPGPVLYQLRGEHGAVLETAGEDKLNRSYLPGQVHVFGGRAYRIGRIDPDTRTLALEHCQPRGELRYRRALAVRVAGCRPVDNPEARSHTRRNDLRVVRELCACDFTVATLGYFSPAHELPTPGPGGSRYTDLARDERQPVPDRRWPAGRALRLRFELPGEFRPEAPRLAFTLAALITEALPTLLPEIHEAVLVGAFLPEGFFATPGLEAWFPRFGHEGGPMPATDGEELEIFVLEDARQDTGAIQCLFDKYEVLFEALYDYLAWFAATNPPRPFLAYGLEAVPPEFALDTAQRFLERLELGCGPDSLNASRRVAAQAGQRPGTKAPATDIPA